MAVALRSKAIGFIGLGRMGSEMAFNLFSKRFAAAEDSLFVICDANIDSAKSFQQNFLGHFPGAKLEHVSEPHRLVEQCETIVTMLPSSPQVKEVYGRHIIPVLNRLPGHEAGLTLCIDSTTLDVDVARDVSGQVTSAGAAIIDAPVSGGVTGAKAGTLSFLVGGPESSFHRANPLLSYMGKRIIHCGPSGSGLTAKICNNLVLGVQQVVVAEAMILGHKKLGLNPKVLADVINTSTGACWASAVNNPVPHALEDKSPPCERDYSGGFATGLMLKDMRLATKLAEDSGSPLPLGQAAERIYEGMTAELDSNYASKDFSSVYQYLQQK